MSNGLRIKEVIKEKGLTIEAVAKQIGVLPSALSQSINGNPTVERLQQIAGILNTPVTDLFESKNEVRLYAEYQGEKIELTHSDIIRLIEQKKTAK